LVVYPFFTLDKRFKSRIGLLNRFSRRFSSRMIYVLPKTYSSRKSIKRKRRLTLFKKAKRPSNFIRKRKKLHVLKKKILKLLKKNKNQKNENQI